MSKRVAYIGIKGLPSKAGADRVVEAIVSGVDKNHYQPVVYVSSQVVPEETVIPDVELIRITALPGKHLHAMTLFLLSALHAFFFGNFDLIHLHNAEVSFMLPLLRLRYKVISTSHAVPQTREKWGKFAKWCMKMTEYPFIYFSNTVTSVARPLADYYDEHYHTQMNYIPNGVDDDIVVDEVSAEALLSEYGLEPGNFLLFAAGRIIPSKGCHFVLEALNQIDTDIPLLVVGDYSQLPEYTKKIKEMANERVVFGTFVSSKATLMGLISHAKLFIFPSTYEAMSMMLLEAVSAGTPIVASDIAENTGILPEQVLFFESANSADLRDKLVWALDHPQEMHELSARARIWVNKNYRWVDIVKQYERLYDEMLMPTHQAVPNMQSL